MFNVLAVGVNLQIGHPTTVCLEKLFPFCYHCTFCSVLLPFSVPFYYRSPFRFFCRLRLNGTVSPQFYLVTCNTYVLASYVHRRDSDKTYASCWLARVAMPKAYSNYTKQVVIYVPSPPGPASNRVIYRENCSRRESRQPDEESPSS